MWGMEQRMKDAEGFYVCEECGYRFDQKGGLNDHMKDEHKD